MIQCAIIFDYDGNRLLNDGYCYIISCIFHNIGLRANYTTDQYDLSIKKKKIYIYTYRPIYESIVRLLEAANVHDDIKLTKRLV
jgi:hypothetical protein